MKIYILLGKDGDGEFCGYDGVFKTKEAMVDWAIETSQNKTLHLSTNPEFACEIVEGRYGTERTAFIFEERETDDLK